MADTELKARHRKMWASGDYPSMVETFLLPLGPTLVKACGIGPGMRVLDVAAGIKELFGDRVDFGTLDREMLDITAFEHPHEYGQHFKERYGPTIVARANAEREGREGELDEALDRFSDEWNLGTPDRARFEQEYLVAVGTRA